MNDMIDFNLFRSPSHSSAHSPVEGGREGRSGEVVYTEISPW